MRRYTLFFLSFLLLYAPLSAGVSYKEFHQMKKQVEEVRILLMDLQQTTRQHDLALSILEEERTEKKSQGGSYGDASLQERIVSLEKKLQHFEQQFSVMESLIKKELHELATFIGNAPGTKNSNTQDRYIVKSGDTLDKIARTHHTTVDTLLQKNNLSSTTIFVGQELIVPSP